MERYYNKHTAAVAGIPAGGTKAVDPSHRSIKGAVKAGLLIPEGQVLASQATAALDAPNAGELLKLRAECERLNAVIEDLRQRDASRIAEMQRAEARFGEMGAELAASKSRAEKAEAECAEMRTALDAATKPDAAKAQRAERKG